MLLLDDMMMQRYYFFCIYTSNSMLFKNNLKEHPFAGCSLQCVMKEELAVYASTVSSAARKLASSSKSKFLI